METAKYKNILSKLDLTSSDHEAFKNSLMYYQIQPEHSDDYFAWVSAIWALQAIVNNNFGIGCVLVNEKKIISEGHNHVFTPFFRSDRHAEMVVLNKFENEIKKNRTKSICIDEYTLYTSLEPCPMCSTRIITSGIGNIKYTVEDDIGGFTRTIDKLPEAWLKLMNKPYKQLFQKADCSSELTIISSKIFFHNAEKLNTKLRLIYKS